MKDKSTLIKVFSGSDVSVTLLTEKLEEEGILASIHDEYSEGITAGFSTGTRYSVDLYIMDSDLAKAKPIIDEYIRINDIQ